LSSLVPAALPSIVHCESFTLAASHCCQLLRTAYYDVLTPDTTNDVFPAEIASVHGSC
jgi:hypothetical protein